MLSFNCPDNFRAWR